MIIDVLKTVTGHVNRAMVIAIRVCRVFGEIPATSLATAKTAYPVTSKLEYVRNVKMDTGEQAVIKLET